MKKIFISATLRTEQNCRFNKALCNFLENHNYEVFLPQRDVDTSTRFSISNDNLEAIAKSDVFISIANTESPNLAFETGFAYALKNSIILIKNVNFIMPDMFYGITTNSKILEVSDLNNIEEYENKLVNRIESF